MTDENKPVVEVAAQKPAPKTASNPVVKSDDFNLLPLPVQSSTISHMGHKGNQMRVLFHSGDVYEYGNISKELFDSIFNNKDSVGKAFGVVRKDKNLYPFRKV